MKSIEQIVDKLLNNLVQEWRYNLNREFQHIAHMLLLMPNFGKAKIINLFTMVYGRSKAMLITQ